MRTLPRHLASLLILAVAGCTSKPGPASVSSDPPAPPREFRAAWVAAVANIDWPSRPGLSTDDQLKEMSAILARAQELKLNALIVQVRPACDALYPSPYEPWSEYLTGQQGKPPEPMYDPLATWIREAHLRGIELHAWFNPYRARHNHAKSATAPGHISRTRPDLVRKFNNWEWLDPGEPEVRRHTLGVILDVARRYDVDGIHIDDYFYPYASYLGAGADFPDAQSYQRYQRTGGNLARADWRRDNVNTLVREIYQNLKALKPHVKFGISPFGIWRPNNPPGVTGMDPYAQLYADSRLWLSQGWCDYVSPQLYWPVNSTGQPFAPLLTWWTQQNPHGRHVWPGLYTSLVARDKNPWPAAEIAQQVQIARTQPGAGGAVHFSMKTLVANTGNIASALQSGPYADAAFPPASPWLGANALQAPKVTLMPNNAGAELTWSPAGGTQPFAWGIWVLSGGQWRFSTQPFHIRQVKLAPASRGIDAAAVIAVDRVGNISPTTVVRP